MIGPLLAFCLLAGMVLIALGLADTQRQKATSRLAELRRRVRQTGMTSPRVLLAVLAGTMIGLALAWALTPIPVLAVAGGFAGGYAPLVWVRRQHDRAALERERAWPSALAQLADALEAGIAFPTAVAMLGETGPAPLRVEFTRLRAGLRSDGLGVALEQLAASGERTAGTVALLLRAGLVELPAGGLAPLLRDLSVMLRERFEAREKARSKASSLQVEAAILALSPIVLLLLVGTASPAYLAAYRSATGTAVAIGGGIAIFACYLLMRRLGRLPEPRRKEGAQ